MDERDPCRRALDVEQDDANTGEAWGHTSGPIGVCGKYLGPKHSGWNF
jgi:hypothetical protein